MVERGAHLEVADAAVEHLARKGLVNDERCSESLRRRYEGRKAAGPGKLAALLRERGASEEFIDGFFAASRDADLLEPMLEALRTKFAPNGDRAKAARFLLSRGFDEDNLESALDRFFGESQTPS